MHNFVKWMSFFAAALGLCQILTLSALFYCALLCCLTPDRTWYAVPWEYKFIFDSHGTRECVWSHAIQRYTSSRSGSLVVQLQALAVLQHTWGDGEGRADIAALRLQPQQYQHAPATGGRQPRHWADRTGSRGVAYFSSGCLQHCTHGIVQI
jgi:hypothetical protein